ncbi:MAG TPA: polysaccharide deacetylase family protein [Gemmataceae bacterium]|nr:polysaccharide deacetylase family protein [Gemmataceae bacterium]
MMSSKSAVPSRRELLACSAGFLASASWAAPAKESAKKDKRKALVAITLDLEMSRNFPTWETTHWDYEKGNLNAETKKYAVEAARRVRAHGGRLHYFAVGQVFEQANVDWLKEIVQAGHPVGNHTYDHVNVRATRPGDIQYRFNRAPWLIEGKKPQEVIRENIRLCSAALKTRIGVDPAGFRTPGGFADCLADRPDVRKMLVDLGFSWVSSKYPAHPNSVAGREPDAKILDGIVAAQRQAQPFVYPGGLIEVPMSPISDIAAFRTGRWKLAWFLKALRLALEWVLDNEAVFDFLGHPSCLYVMDPDFKAIEMICAMTRKAGERAALVDLRDIAERARAASR